MNGTADTPEGILVLYPSSAAPALLGRFDELGVEPRLIDCSNPPEWRAAACWAVRAARKTFGGVIVIYPPGAASENLTSVREMVDCGADDAISSEDPELPALLHSTVNALNHSITHQKRLEEFGLIGGSAAMRRLRGQLARAIACGDAPILLLGETGTGKYLAAAALHAADPARAGTPFHALDCGAVADGLFGSELFGHVRGAFTGALSSRPGAIASAGTGTLLLDEIGDLSLALQANFLTALQERRFRAVGSDREQSIQCRIVSATNKDLPALAERGEFREDLLYRLDGIRITLPPLRDRREDIPLLFEAFVQRHSGIPDPVVTVVDSEVREFVAGLSLPGNVRQLECIARAAVAETGPGRRVRLPHVFHALTAPRAAILKPHGEPGIEDMIQAGMAMDAIIMECKKAAVEAAMRMVGDAHPDAPKTKRIKLAAQLLGVSERHIYDCLRPLNSSEA